MSFIDKMKSAASNVAENSMQSASGAFSDMKESISHAGEALSAEARDSGFTSAARIESDEPVLYQAVTHIDGKNAAVRLFWDRLEWDRPRGVSAKKLATGLATGGVSLLVTGVKGGKDAFDVLYLRHVTGASMQKDGLLYYQVRVKTSGGDNDIPFRVHRNSAQEFRGAILKAVQEYHDRSDGITRNEDLRADRQPALPAEPQPAAIEAPSIEEKLARLASFKEQGIITEDEYAAKRAELIAEL